MTRRDLLASAGVAVGALPVRTAPGATIRGPIFNQDDSEFFSVRPPEEATAEEVRRWVDSLADAGVGTLVSCVCAMRTNYASSVWEPRWTGYDPEAPDDQPVLAHLAPESVPAIRRWVESEKALADRGANFHELAFARCRERGLGAWASIRMNDLHDCDLPDSPLLSGFYKAQRDAGLLRVQYRPSGWMERALDWELPEVREHYLALVREVLAFEGIEGLELDWMRFPWHFRIGRELAGGEALTQWIAEVRGLCAERGVRLGCRVPSDPGNARRLGLDGARWAREGLLDLLVPTPFWSTCEFDQPLETWAALLAGTGCALAGGLEIRYQPHPGGPAIMMTPALATGAATAVLAGGADAVYLFNYFLRGHLTDLWSPEEHRETLGAMASLASLSARTRRVGVTWRDTTPAGEPAARLLPAEGGVALFRLRTGPRPSGRPVTALLEFEGLPEGEAPAFELRANSVPCGAPTREGATLTWSIPKEALIEGETVLEAIGFPGRIVRVEVLVE